MAVWAVWIVGLVLLCVEGSVMHLLGMDDMTLQVSLVLISYAGLRRDLQSSMLLVLGWMMPMDWFSGGPAGLHAFGLMVAFWALRTVALRFERQWNLGKVLLTGAATMIYHVAILAVFMITAPDSPVFDAVLYTLFHGVLMAAAVSVVLGFMLGRLERSLNSRKGRDGLSFS